MHSIFNKIVVVTKNYLIIKIKKCPLVFSSALFYYIISCKVSIQLEKIRQKCFANIQTEIKMNLTFIIILSYLCLTPYE